MIPYYNYPSPQDDRNIDHLPIREATKNRLHEFNRTHPGVDLRPYIDEQVNDTINNVLDACEKAEKA